MAKTYAFFLELLARYEKSFPAVCLGSLKFERERGPFAWIYLYDAINQRDRLLNSRKQVAEIVKTVWETINFGPMADRYRGLLEHMRTQAPAIFSAAGVAGLEFPVKRLKEQGSYRTGLAVLEKLLTPPTDIDGKVQQFFENFLRQQPHFTHLPDLRHDVNGKPLTLSYRQFEGNLAHTSRQQLLPAMEIAELDDEKIVMRP